MFESIQVRPQLSKIAGGIDLFLMQNSYSNLLQVQEQWFAVFI